MKYTLDYKKYAELARRVAAEGTAAGKAADTAGSVRKVRTSSSEGEKYCAECPGIY